MKTLIAALLLMAGGAAMAAPVTYAIDPDHTHPAFEADHFGGLSVWRGLFRKTTGTVVLDPAAGTGSVDVTVDAASVDFGLPALETVVTGPQYFDTAKYPTAHFSGALGGFSDGKPTTLTGQLTLHGITRPLTLKLVSFKCVQHPLLKREWCGADAYGSLDRAEFGMDSGKEWGFSMQVTLRIQVEAIAQPKG